MKIRLFLLVVVSLLSSCAVIKGMHEDALEAKAHPAAAPANLPHAQPSQTGAVPQQNQGSRNASETAGKLLSPIIQ
jgi:hypothetical protein